VLCVLVAILLGLLSQVQGIGLCQMNQRASIRHNYIGPLDRGEHTKTAECPALGGGQAAFTRQPTCVAKLLSFATASQKSSSLVCRCRKSRLHNSRVPIQLCDMLIGYARVSTDDQDLRLQRAALKEVGCKRTFEEKISGAKRDRHQLIRMIEQLRDEDTVVVTRLDRLARSTRDLLDIAEKLKEAGAGLRSLAEPWADTTSPAGRMVLTVFAGIAEFERELIHQRTSSGRVAAKARGVRFGRPPKLTPDQIALGERLVSEGTSVREAAKLLKCHHATLYRALTAAALAL
jgi:DNA invertase Pin-like site-specific DNA recombinase